MSAWSRSRARAMSWLAAPTTPYVAAIGVRTAARAVWGLALPAALSVAAYGRYQVIATAAAMAAQLALLGIPQTIVRYVGRRLPVRLLTVHTAVLGAAAIACALALVPTTRTPAGLAALAVMVVAVTTSTVFGARAKARFAFSTSLRAEVAGGIVLAIATVGVVTGLARTLITPIVALLIESLALAATAALLWGARPAADTTLDEPSPPTRTVFGDIYSVGALVLLDVVLLRRLEVYFLERSPDGLPGVAVLGLALQIAAVALLVPTALLEAWQPRLALVRATSEGAFERELARRARQFLPIMTAVVVLGTLVPLVAVPVLFPHYGPWLAYVVAFVFIRLGSAGAGFYSAALYATGRHRVLYAPALVGALVAVIGNASLTRTLGLRGALLAYGATQLTLAVLTVAAFYRTSPRPGPSPAPVTAVS